MIVKWILRYISFCLGVLATSAIANVPQRVVDIPTRSGVTQRMLVLTPERPNAVVVMLAGGEGGLRITAEGEMKWGMGNFLVRTRQLFAAQGLVVVIVDSPSDHQSYPYLEYMRETDEHVADLRAVIAWARDTTHLPVWLVGTSRGTQSVAYVATQLLGADRPDGIVLTSSILATSRGKGRAVVDMPLDKIQIPVLVVHHKQDACWACDYAKVPALMAKFVHTPRSQLLTFGGGNERGNPCEAFAHHGYNGIEAEVIQQIAAWIVAK